MKSLMALLMAAICLSACAATQPAPFNPPPISAHDRTLNWMVRNNADVALDRQHCSVGGTYRLSNAMFLAMRTKRGAEPAKWVFTAGGRHHPGTTQHITIDGVRYSTKTHFAPDVSEEIVARLRTANAIAFHYTEWPSRTFTGEAYVGDFAARADQCMALLN